jgi:hypothetical protein
MTTMAHTWKPSELQVKKLKEIFNERVAWDAPNREQHWKNITQNISNRESFQTAWNDLKALPKIQSAVYPPVTPVAPVKPVRPVLPQVATEAGLYRNPADGTLYRLSVGETQHSWQTPVKAISVYSNKAVYRRLTPEGYMVKKGKWTRLNARERDSLIAFSYAEKTGYQPLREKLLASWFLTEEEKQEWAVGFCLWCSKTLIDAVSVYNACGPDCAKKYHVNRVVPPAKIIAEIEKNVLN